jgi:hypothetical protein
MEKFAAIFTVLLLSQALVGNALAVEDELSSITALSKLGKSRSKRQANVVTSITSLLVPMVDSFCKARCAKLALNVQDELLKAMLPCSSICTLINVGMKSLTGLLTELLG